VRQVHSAYPHSTGFHAILDESFIQNDTLTLRCEFEGGAQDFIKPLKRLSPSIEKRRRLERIRPCLRKDLSCRETPFHFDYLTPELQASCAVSPTENVSGFEYTQSIREKIDRCAGGLALDCGAGCRPSTIPHVINLEIVPYESTDVLAVNEQLPFLDNSFDLVISVAVLEHVRDPFAAAREIIRVTKPGGVIHADIPFLQPFHGYPSHFYNMTIEGAKNLFSAKCDIEQAYVPHYGTPVWTLTWFLQKYLEGLPSGTRERFAELRVKDLIGSSESYLGEAWVKELSAEKNIELSCCNTVVARKK
jgi:SAM-dependent methyltransferase